MASIRSEKHTRRSTRRTLLCRGASAVLAGGVGLGGLRARGRAENASAKPSPAGKPNFLLILADDMGYSDAGCYGGEIATPNLDGLAARGLQFTQMYSAGRCWPSRACLMTGYYAQQVRMDPPHGRLPAWARLAPHYLKPLGYRCYHSGKWHIRGAPKPVQDGGFDRSYHLSDQDRFFSPRRHALDDKPLPAPKPDGSYYATTAIAEHAIGCLRDHAAQHAGKPFFQYLAFTCPHFPLQARQEDIARYRGKYAAGWDALRRSRYERMRKRKLLDCALSPLQPEVKPPWNLPEAKLQEQIGRGEIGRAVPWNTLTAAQKKLQATKMAIHAAMIDRMDREIGRVLAQVRAMGAWENTVTVFLSDNGASAEQIIRGDRHDPKAKAGSWRSYLCLGPGFSTAANTPLRYHKSWVHEGGISSPCLVHWPAGVKAVGQLRHNPGHFVDVLPTLVDLAGGRMDTPWNGKPTPPPAGRSLASVLARDGAARHEYLYWHHLGNRAIRVGDWKLVAPGRQAPWELYDLRADRSETRDLADKHPEKVKELAALWARCEKRFRARAGSDGPPPRKRKG